MWWFLPPCFTSHPFHPTWKGQRFVSDHWSINQNRQRFWLTKPRLSLQTVDLKLHFWTWFRVISIGTACNISFTGQCASTAAFSCWMVSVSAGDSTVKVPSILGKFIGGALQMCLKIQGHSTPASLQKKNSPNFQKRFRSIIFQQHTPYLGLQKNQKPWRLESSNSNIFPPKNLPTTYFQGLWAPKWILYFKHGVFLPGSFCSLPKNITTKKNTKNQESYWSRRARCHPRQKIPVNRYGPSAAPRHVLTALPWHLQKLWWWSLDTRPRRTAKSQPVQDVCLRTFFGWFGFFCFFGVFWKSL